MFLFFQLISLIKKILTFKRELINNLLLFIKLEQILLKVTLFLLYPP